MSRSVRWWLAALVVAVSLIWAGTRPLTLPGPLPDFSDKIGHAVSWGVLAALLALGGRARGWPRRLALAAAVAVAVAHGGLLEWLQAHVPGREASLGDLIADAIGAVAGGAGALYGSRRHGDRP